MKEHITIGKKAFIAPVRYLEGHVCTEQEANQLNRDIIGKARNNLATKDGLTQDELDKWVGNFTFGSRNGRDPVLAEAKLIAKKMIDGGLKGKKKSGKQLLQEIDRLLTKNSKIIEEAERRVRALRALSEAALANG